MNVIVFPRKEELLLRLNSQDYFWNETGLPLDNKVNEVVSKFIARKIYFEKNKLKEGVG